MHEMFHAHGQQMYLELETFSKLGHFSWRPLRPTDVETCLKYSHFQMMGDIFVLSTRFTFLKMASIHLFELFRNEWDDRLKFFSGFVWNRSRRRWRAKWTLRHVQVLQLSHFVTFQAQLRMFLEYFGCFSSMPINLCYSLLVKVEQSISLRLSIPTLLG